ncbi:MAG TPA: Maf family protein [Ignavibacteria bacterium]
MNISDIFKYKYVLASKSPRRVKLLKQIGLDFISVDSDYDEIQGNKYKPIDLIEHNSSAKAGIVSKKYPGNIIIAADTIVTINRNILNKPENKEQATKFLRFLSGKKHIVYTGITVINTINKKSLFDFTKTNVYFRKLNPEEISYYIKNHTPLDKAGAYGIQDDFGCLFIDKINGDYYNVVGLPLVKLYEMLLKVIKSK